MLRPKTKSKRQRHSPQASQIAPALAPETNKGPASAVSESGELIAAGGISGPVERARIMMGAQRTIGNTGVSRLLDILAQTRADSNGTNRTTGPSGTRSTALKSPPIIRKTMPSGNLIQRHGEHSGLSPEEKYSHTLAHAGIYDSSVWESDYRSAATFLGVPIRNGVHRELAERLALAEDHLRSEYASEGLTDAQIGSRIGIRQIRGIRPPRRASGRENISFHSFGLAIDVNWEENLYIAMSREEGEIIERATELVNGRSIDIREPGGLSIRELFYRYHSAALALYRYVQLLGDRSRVVEALTRIGIPTYTDNIEAAMSQIEQDVRNLRARNPGWDPSTTLFFNLPSDLVTALCEEAGLFWGGQYRGGADLQHFDWRGGTVRPEHRV